MKQESINLARGSIGRMLLTLALMMVSVASWGASYTANTVVECGKTSSAAYTNCTRKTLYHFTASKTGILNVSYSMQIYLITEGTLSNKTLTYTSQVSPSSYTDASKATHYSIKADVEAGKEYYIWMTNKKTGSTLKFIIETPTFVEMEADKEYTTPDIEDLSFYKITAASSGELTITNTNNKFTVRSGVTSTSMGTSLATATANSEATAYTYTMTVTKGQELYVQTYAPDQTISYTLKSDEPELEGTEMLLDTDYEISGVFKEHLFHLVPTESGKIVVKANDGGVVPRIFTDAAHTDANEVTSTFSYTSTGGQRVFEATAGTVYYLYVETNSSTTKTVRAEMLKDVEFTSVSPEAGTVFSINGTGELSVKFNMSVSMSKATLTCGTVVKELSRESSGLSILFHIKTILGDMLKSGAAKAGDKFTVKITGICDATDASNVYGDDGTYTVEYIMPEMPMTLESTTKPDPFLSYWAAGDDAGKLVLTFSEDVYSGDNTSYAPTAYLAYGNLDKDNEGEYYYETLPVSVSDNTLTIDFTDKIRTPQTMLPNQQSDSLYTTINVKVGNIRNADGKLCYTEQSATTGSFTYSMDYELVSYGEVTWEWLPESGESISEKDNIELFLSGSEALRYDGVSFAYTEEGVADTIKVANSDITSTKEDDGISLAIPVPTKVKTKNNVKVFPTNLICIDGIDRDISVTYNPAFAVTMLNPTEKELEKLGYGDTVRVTTNRNYKVGYLTMQVTDLNPTDPNEAIVWPYCQLADSIIEATNDTIYKYAMEDGQELTFLKGHTYRFDFIGAESDEAYRKGEYVGTDYYTLTGLSNEYEYSTVKFMSIDPDPDETTIDSYDQNTFVVTFDGLVKINSLVTFVDYGKEGTKAFESITPVDEGATAETELSSKWQFVVSDDIMKEIKNDLSFSVGVFDQYDRPVNQYDESCLMDENKEFSGTKEKACFMFNYKSYLGSPDFTVTPADGSYVKSLSSFVTEYSEGIYPSWDVNEKEIKIYDESGAVVAYCKELTSAEPEWPATATKNTFSLNTEITAVGTYTMVIPSKFFYLDDDNDATYSKATTVHFTIADPVEVTIGSTGYATLYYSDKPLEVPEGVNAWTYSASGDALTATETYPAGSIIPEGEAVVLRTETPDTYSFNVVSTDAEKVADNAMKGTDEATTVTAADGNKLYKLANGSEGMGFYLVSEDGLSFTNKAHKAYLEVSADMSAKFFGVDGGTTGISSISSEAANNANIYNLQGQKLNNMNRSGLYIVGGKKVVVK